MPTRRKFLRMLGLGAAGAAVVPEALAAVAPINVEGLSAHDACLGFSEVAGPTGHAWGVQIDTDGIITGLVPLCDATSLAHSVVADCFVVAPRA